ncbi:probable inactive receptor kinase At2g26730 [Magnolia sinica]|uniref:probable inactive receptor kinase At2g26730 n=1 Tax=Magnolia sinica TaxID=86752 RepID=UPI00265A6CB4|nr:probable inactive receptor kinase At2g26730 [Magnolia sinica]
MAAGTWLYQLIKLALKETPHVFHFPAKMEVPKTLTLANYILIYLLVFSGDPTVGDYQSEERDALYALKYAFNDPFLNKNWNHLQCFKNNPNTTWYGITCVDGRVTGISLDSLGLAGQVPVNVLFNLTELIHLSFRNNSISGDLMNFSANWKLTNVDLSDNKFSGPISPSLTGLGSLVSLKLQDNFLIGKIPWFGQPSLREFNVSNNNLSGEIPATPTLQSFQESSYSNNPGLCGPPSPAVCKIDTVSGGPSDKPPHKNKSNLTGASLISIFVVLDIIALVLVIILFSIYYKKAKSKKREREVKSKLEKEAKRDRGSGGTRVTVIEERGTLSFIGQAGGFELNDLLKASAEELGKGSFGSSYKAMIDGMAPVVVKRMRDLSSFTRERFAKHVKVVADLKHPNLLPLLAYYHSKDEKLLIYRFAPNGNLFNRIHGGKGKDRIPFKWNSRLLVAQGVARAMAYLHLKATKQDAIPHGNLKSSNVLLDENELPLVSDYGLVPLIAGPAAVERMVSYKSPEHQQGRKASIKSDVWSYGCLLLELITGRVPSHSAPPGVHGVDLYNWANRAVREEWTVEIFDIEISVQRGASEGALKLLQIALNCCNESMENRPNMEEVARDVDNIRLSNSDENSDSLSLTDDSTSGSFIVGDERYSRS